MTPHDLMQIARALAELGPGHPTQAQFRRAVSTIYYAMFHALAAAAADLVMGPARDPAWCRAYRSLEHGQARKACQQVRAMGEFPASIRKFARVFVESQVERQQADYAPDKKDYEASDVLASIASTEETIDRFERADADSRRKFIAHVLFRQRP